MVQHLLNKTNDKIAFVSFSLVTQRRRWSCHHESMGRVLRLCVSYHFTARIGIMKLCPTLHLHLSLFLVLFLFSSIFVHHPNLAAGNVNLLALRNCLVLAEPPG